MIRDAPAKVKRNRIGLLGPLTIHAQGRTLTYRINRASESTVESQRNMRRVIATLPESISELCLIRMGIQAKRLTALPYVRRLSRAIDREARAAIQGGAGLLHSERFLSSWNHFGVLQYWSSFEALDAWSHRAPHAEWWRELVQRSRTRGDVGVYHETFLVPRTHIETIYLACESVGLSAFGALGEPVGPLTTSRDRLGRRPPSPQHPAPNTQ